MAYLLPQDIQSWLNHTNIVVPEIDPILERNAISIVLGRIATRYTTTDWVDNLTTPPMPLIMASMLYAAWFYQATYSEIADVNAENWGRRLENSVNNMLDQVASGELDLIDAIGAGDEIVGGHGPLFFPTDLQATDEEGSEIKFTMGARF